MNKLFIFFLLFAKLTFAQDSLTLSICYENALKNYPLVKDKISNKEIFDLKMNNIRNTYMPVINLSAQATVQSDVTKVEIPIPNLKIPSPSIDQYKIYLDINQTIYDGGMSKYQKEYEKTSIETDNQNIEVQLYQLKDRINQVYFLILMFQEQIKILNSAKQNLALRLKFIESAVKNGTLTQVNTDIVRAEILKVDQQIDELENGIKSSFAILNELTGISIDSKKGVQKPFIISDTIKGNRPEYTLFELQKNKILSLQNIASTKKMPRLAAFAQLGYAKPGLNMFKDEFTPYFIVGAKFIWNLWDWNTTKNERQIISVQSNMIETQREIFTKTINIAVAKEIANIQKYESMLKKDDEIIAIRSRVVTVYQSQMENGVIKASDYTTELNNETQAKLNRELHRIQLLQAKTNYNNLIGK